MCVRDWARDRQGSTDGMTGVSYDRENTNNNNVVEVDLMLDLKREKSENVDQARKAQRSS